MHIKSPRKLLPVALRQQYKRDQQYLTATCCIKNVQAGALLQRQHVLTVYVHDLMSWHERFTGRLPEWSVDWFIACTGNPYADENGAFGDNVFRFSLLSMAACEAPLVLPIGGHRQAF